MAAAKSLVLLTFVPAIATSIGDGSRTEPDITIYVEDEYGDVQYAFPFLTNRIYSIMQNVVGSDYIIRDFRFTPERITLIVEAKNRDDVDALVDRVNYDYTEGEDWGDLNLDAETLIPLANLNLAEDTSIGFIPLLEDYKILDSGPNLDMEEIQSSLLYLSMM